MYDGYDVGFVVCGILQLRHSVEDGRPIGVVKYDGVGFPIDAGDRIDFDNLSLQCYAAKPYYE